MNEGRAGWVIAWAALAVALVGCSDGSDSGDPKPNMGPATPDCGSVQEPQLLTLKDVQPALGASLPNAGIVQTFTIAGKLLKIVPSFATPTAHTAGRPTSEPVVWRYLPSGTDTIYQSAPVTWQTAPGHVELTPPGLLVSTNGCVSTLPSPTFSYDITAP